LYRLERGWRCRRIRLTSNLGRWLLRRLRRQPNCEEIQSFVLLHFHSGDLFQFIIIVKRLSGQNISTVIPGKLMQDSETMVNRVYRPDLRLRALN